MWRSWGTWNDRRYGAPTDPQLDGKQIEENPGFAAYFVDHTAGVYPTSASGSPWNAASIGVKGDTIADLNEDLAAEQKARVTYDNILRMVDDPDIIQPIKFLREREIVHYQRFGEGLRVATDKLNSKNYYMTNPSFLTNKPIKIPRYKVTLPLCRGAFFIGL